MEDALIRFAEDIHHHQLATMIVLGIVVEIEVRSASRQKDQVRPIPQVSPGIQFLDRRLRRYNEVQVLFDMGRAAIEAIQQ